jgi:hypothetical protein
VSELLTFTVAKALERIRGGEFSSDEYFDAYAEAAAKDELNAYLWNPEPGDRPAPDGSSAAGEGELAGVPIDHGGISHPRGVPAAVQRDRGSSSRRGGRAPARQDEHG